MGSQVVFFYSLGEENKWDCTVKSPQVVSFVHMGEKKTLDKQKKNKNSNHKNKVPILDLVLIFKPSKKPRVNSTPIPKL
jgi:hypothetical protein